MCFSKVSAIALFFVFPLLPVQLPGLLSSAAIAQTQPSTDRRTQALNQIVQADWLISAGLPEAGEPLRDEGLRTLQEMGDHLRAAEILEGIGNTSHSSGRLQEALTYYQQALEIYQGRIVSPIDRYHQLYKAHETAIDIGRVYQALGQYDQAMAAYEQAIAIARRSDSTFTLPDGFVQLGTLYQLRGQPEQALAAYQQALPYYQEIRAYSTQFMNQLGLLYQSQGQFESALLAYQTGLAALEDREPELSRLIDQVLTLENISELYRAQEQIEQAENYARQATNASLGPTGYRDDFRDGPDEVQRAGILQEIGGFYLQAGQIERGQTYFDRALAIIRDSSDYYAKLNILRGIEINYEELGLFEQTIPYRQQMAEVYQANGLLLEAGESLRSLGETYQQLEQWDAALEAYQQAIATFERLTQAYEISGMGGSQDDEIMLVLFQMGQVYQAQGKPEQALAIYQQLLADSQGGSYPVLPAQVLQQMGKLYESQGQSDQAEQSYQQAAALREQVITRIQSVPMPTVY